MGYIALEANNQSAHVRLCFEQVKAPSAAAVLRFFRDHPVERVLVSRLSGEWRHELLPPYLAVVRFSALVTSARAA